MVSDGKLDMDISANAIYKSYLKPRMKKNSYIYGVNP